MYKPQLQYHQAAALRLCNWHLSLLYWQLHRSFHSLPKWAKPQKFGKEVRWEVYLYETAPSFLLLLPMRSFFLMCNGPSLRPPWIYKAEGRRRIYPYYENTRLLSKRIFLLCLQFSESRLTRVKQGGRMKHVSIILHKMLVHVNIDGDYIIFIYSCIFLFLRVSLSVSNSCWWFRPTTYSYTRLFSNLEWAVRFCMLT